MERDDDLLRDLMVEVETHPFPLFLFVQTMRMTPKTKQRYFHLRLLSDAGLLQESGEIGGVFRMTNSGLNFLTAIRSESNWTKIKGIAANASEHGVGILRDIAVGRGQQEVTNAVTPLA